MEIQINKCDKCGREARNDTQKEDYNNYEAISIEVSSRGAYNWAAKRLLLCENCMLKVGAKKIKEGEKTKHDPDLKERLYDIFAELVQEIAAHN